jgi:hypothetical protein
MGKVARILAGLIVAVAASGQFVTTIRPTQPVALPARRPEPRFRVAEDPSVIFQGLISPSSVRRRHAILQLGWKEQEKFAEDPTLIGDARFYRVNLDDDPEMEAILMLNVGSHNTEVLVFKRSEGRWWCVGVFSLWYMWTSDDAGRMLELRNIVDFDNKDIVVRLTAGGTDIQKEIELSIYRLCRGRLYRTFELTEEFALRKFPSPGAMMIEDDRHFISYPEPKQGEDPYIVVHRSTQSVPASEWDVIERLPTIVDCVPYRWNPVKYLFIADRSASPRFCLSMSERGREKGR